MLRARSATLMLFLAPLVAAGAGPGLHARAGTDVSPGPLSPRTANYDIDVRLDPVLGALDGREILTWRNTSSDTIRELRFHLYLNAYRNTRSTFMRESKGTVLHEGREDERWGYIEVDRILLSSGEEITDRLEYIHPDDDNQDDRTVFRLPLHDPVPPGGGVSLTIVFHALLPDPAYARTGILEEYVFAGQWFPKVGVYMDGAWNCHQFHARSEFFADFGVYDVRITVPSEHVVGATGMEVGVTDNGDGTATHHYRAEDVHDFAWTASPEFLEFVDTAQDVEIRLLLQPDHAGQARRHLAAVKLAVEALRDWIGDYPYPNLTVVDPRRGAGGSAGMEYPTLFTAGTWYGMPGGLRILEQTVIHEFAHQYWYHLVATNEFEEPWLDEGLATYTEMKVMNEAYGPEGDLMDLFGLRINSIDAARAVYLGGPGIDPVVRDAWTYYSERSWVVNSYLKPALMLETLDRYLGDGMMEEILRTYFERWKFRHPGTGDFTAVAEEVAGPGLGRFFDQALLTNAVLDYSVDQVYTREVTGPEGYDFTLPVREEHVRGLEGDFAPAARDTTPPGDGGEAETMYLSRVKVRRLGEFVFPVEVEVVFENGEVVRELWDGSDPWKKYVYVKPARLVSATVDPDRKIVLDVNFTNNSRTAEDHLLGIVKTSARWMFWVQLFFDMPWLPGWVPACLPSP